MYRPHRIMPVLYPLLPLRHEMSTSNQVPSAALALFDPDQWPHLRLTRTAQPFPLQILPVLSILPQAICGICRSLPRPPTVKTFACLRQLHQLQV